MQSDQVLHQSGSGKENGDGEKKYEAELENEVTEGNVGVGARVACCRIHAKVDAWVIHHP